MDYQETQAARQKMMDDCEAQRREKPTMDCSPIPGIVDYGEAGSMLDNAIAHWDESIPTGQRRRTELAAVMVARSVRETLTWLRAKGYRVPVIVEVDFNEDSLNDEVVDAFALALKERIKAKGKEGKSGWEHHSSLDNVIMGYLRHAIGGNLLDAGAYLAMLKYHGLTSTPGMPEFPIVHAQGVLETTDASGGKADGYVVMEGSSVTVDPPEGYDNAPDLFSDKGASDPAVDDRLRQEYEASGSYQLEQPQGHDGVAPVSRRPDPATTLNPKSAWPFAPSDLVSLKKNDGSEPTARGYVDQDQRDKPNRDEPEHPVAHIETHYPPSER